MCHARKIFSIRKFLAFDLQLRQCALQFLRASVRYLGARNAERLQLFQAMQFLESGTGQLRPVQVETAELRQADKLFTVSSQEFVPLSAEFSIRFTAGRLKRMKRTALLRRAMNMSATRVRLVDIGRIMSL